MSVKIKVELDATDVAKDIGAIETALASLDGKSNEIDLGDSIDADGITGKIGEIVGKLEELETDSDAIADNLAESFSEIPDEIEVKHDHQTPDGGTNNGDSRGKPRINTGGFLDAQKKAAEAGGTTTDGGSRANLLERTYGEHIAMGKSDLGGLEKHYNSKISNLGEGAPGFSAPDEGDARMVGTRSGFGMDSVAMDLRRNLIPETLEELQNAGDVSSGQSAAAQVAQEGIAQRLLNSRQLQATLGKENMGFESFNGDKRDAVPETDAEIGRATKSINGIPDFEDVTRGTEGGTDLIDIDAAKEAKRQASEALQEGVLGEERSVGGYDFTDFNSDARAQSDIQFGELMGQTRGDGFQMDFGRSGSTADILKDTNIGKKLDNIDDLGDAFDGLGDAQSGLKTKLRNLFPTMGKYMQLLAALIPVAVALGTQLLGVAAAMGAVGAAGAGIIGLGLLGHADSLQGSMAQAKQQVKDLKKEMFDVAQPVMQQFAPIQARAFDALPEGMGGITEEMEGLADYEGTLFELGGALAGGFEEFFSIINDNRQAISNLTSTFGGIIGSGLLKFFEWLIQTASQNEQLIHDLSASLISLAETAYNLSMAIGRIVAAFQGVFTVLSVLTSFLNNKYVVGLLSSIAVMATMAFMFMKVSLMAWGLVSAVSSLVTFLSILGGGSMLAGIMAVFSEMVLWIQAAIAHFTALELAALSAAGAIAATGIGAIVVAGGMAAAETMTPDVPSGGAGGVGGMGGGGKTVYNDNRKYTINNGGGDDYASRKATEDTIARVNETETAQDLPSVETSSSTSDNGSNN